MKRKGFTLIELLAVIVVLAIIVLIATPIVMNVIKNAQKGAAERSAERYLDAVETAIATDRLENDLIPDGTYNIVDGQLEGTTLNIEVSGDYPKSGTVAIKNGQVVATGTSMTIGDYTVIIDDKGKATAEEIPEVVKDAEYYGINYYTASWYGEAVPTTFFYIDSDKAPEGFYELFQAALDEISTGQNIIEQQFLNTYAEYLSEISNFIFNNYETSVFDTGDSFFLEVNNRISEGSHFKVYKDNSGNLKFNRCEGYA